jgi:membrane-associated phospholipid phosphatase
MSDIEPKKTTRRSLLKAAAASAAGALSNASFAQKTETTAASTSRALGRASFAKTLAHETNGDVSAATLAQFEAATQGGRVADWEALPVQSSIRLVNPLAGYGWERDPLYADVIRLPAFLKLDSLELAEQALELYWMALLRDVPLWDYARNALVRDAVAELRTTKLNANATAETLFRLNLPGESQGNYVSQMLWMPIPYGAHMLWQAYRTPFKNTDFMTAWDEYQKVIRGDWPPGILNHFAELFYLRSGRDLGEYVHWDFSHQAFINAASILLGNPHRPRENWPATNPYKTSRTMNGFLSYGPAHIHNMMGMLSDVALRACWHEKWIRHRALRPEEYGALVDRVARGESAETIGIHPMILKTEAVKRVREKFGSALLPQSYPEGAPPHPSYPSGHAAIAGACVTVLKAMFDEKRVLRFPLQPTRDGKDWENLGPGQPSPTVGSELNKLAANIAMGRNFAGIHWRSDALQGLLLGESIAKAWLKTERARSIEGQQNWLQAFEFTNFSGEKVRVV